MAVATKIIEVTAIQPVGYDLAEQLAIWLEEKDLEGYQVDVSPIRGSDTAIVELKFPPFDGTILPYAIACGLSEDFDLVLRKALKDADGRTASVVFTVTGKKAN